VETRSLRGREVAIDHGHEFCDFVAVGLVHLQSKQLLSRFPSDNLSADHAYEVASGFEGLLGVVARNESGVVIEGRVSLTRRRSKTVSKPACFLSMWLRTNSMIAI